MNNLKNSIVQKNNKIKKLNCYDFRNHKHVKHRNNLYGHLRYE